MKRRSTIFALLLILVLAVSVVAGCGTETATTTQAEPGATTSAQPTTTETAETIATTDRTVTDMAGRQVTVPAELESIATFGSIGVLNAMVETMGAGDKIINQMSAAFTKNDQWKYQYVFAPQIANGPLFENPNREIQIEEVIKADPDLCLVMTKESATLLEGKGLSVVYLEWKTQEDVAKCITLLGEVLNAQDAAADYIAYFDTKVTELEALVAQIPEGERKKVLYGQVTTYTQPHIIAEWWIPAAGGISVTADRPSEVESYEYTAEDLLAWNPDVMVVTSPAMIEELKGDSRLSGITAIKDNAIYNIPTVAHVWGNRTPEQPLTIMWMMNKLYPEVMTGDMLAEEIGYFYDHFFKTKLTAEQIAEIIG